MKMPKNRWPVYLVNLISFLLLAYFILLVISIFFWSKGSSNGRVERGDGSSGHAYTLIYDDPDSLYKSSLEDLSYREYRHKTDSMDGLKNYYSVPVGSSMGAGPLGVASIKECDTCRFADPTRNYYDIEERRYYFFITGFRLPESYYDLIYPRLYYKKGGISYLKYLRLDSLWGPGHKRLYEGHWVNKVIHYRVEDDPANTKGGKRLLIPVSETTHDILEGFCWAWMLGAVLFWWLIARKFVLVLTDIARGKAFTVKNYQRLFFITNIVVLVPAALLIFQLILQWVYYHYYAGDLIIAIDWGSYFGWALAAVVVFLMALAFRKGYSILQEQDLTI